MKIIAFLRAYIKSMRLYYSFITGITGWIGVAYYEYMASVSNGNAVEVAPSPEKK